MTEQEVVKLMESSKSETEWNNNCDTVKSKCNGYPSFWYSAVIASGLYDKVLGEGSSNIAITTLR